ncbi:hypothetical protein HQ520_01725 [bacterium]|nr:hypothetical protein [bacterium]
MDLLLYDSLREFAKPYYSERNDLQDFAHVRRILHDARNLAVGKGADDDLLIFGAHLHDLIFNLEAEIRSFLFSQGLDRNRINEIMKVAWESGKEAEPESLEGACLHDAHMIEGGREYQTAKWLISGGVRMHSLLQVIDFLEDRLFGRYQCATEEAEKIRQDIESFQRQFVENIRRTLNAGAADEPTAYLPPDAETGGSSYPAREPE